MNLAEFRELIDTWGGDTERWPSQARQKAQPLASSSQGAAMLAEAQRLDAVLAQRPHVAKQRAQRAAHAVTLRIAAQPPSRPKWWQVALSRDWMLPATGLACSAVLGISMALSFPYSTDQPVVLSMILDSASLFGGLEVR